MDFSPTLIDRFWKQVDTSGGPDACWLWTGATTTRRGGQRIGQIFNQRAARQTILKAHRVALAIATGELRDDADACHSCDNPLCCNARHLHWGTHSQNMVEQHARHPQPRKPDGHFTRKD